MCFRSMSYSYTSVSYPQDNIPTIFISSHRLHVSQCSSFKNNKSTKTSKKSKTTGRVVSGEAGRSWKSGENAMLEMSEGHTRGSRSWKSGVDVVLEWNRVALVANILDHNNPFLRDEDSRRKLYWYNNPVDPSFIPSGNPAVTQGPPASSRVCH